MIRSGGSWRVAGRLARREVRRHPWRHLLVTGLILVPVLGALAAFSAITTYQDTMQRRDRFVFPTDDIVRSDAIQRTDEAPAGIDTAAHLTSMLPPGTRTEVAWRGADWLVGEQVRPDGDGPQLVGTEVFETAPGSIEEHRFVVDEGRLPRAAGEIFLTTPAAEAGGGWQIGDTVMSARTSRTFEVVGTGVLGETSDRQAAAVTGLPDGFWGQELPGLDRIDVGDEAISLSSQQLLAASVADADARQALVWEHPFVVALGGELDGRLGPGLTMAAAAICAVVAIVASAALAISSRRQLRTIGLLSTVGADPATIRRAMLLQGAIPGLVAGLAAVAIALLAAAVANGAGLLEHVSHVSGSQFALSPSGSAVAVLLAVAAGTAAAWQPARTSSRIPTLSALAGRRPLGPVPTGVPVAGAIAWAIGASLLLLATWTTRGDDSARGAAPFLIIGGIVAVALGGVGMAPAAIALLEPLAGRLRGTWRMGLRGLARHRMQSAATVAAIGVVLAIPVGLLTARDGAEDRSSTVDDECCLPATTAPTDAFGSDPVLRTDGHGVVVDISGALRSEAAEDVTAEVQELLGPTAAVIETLPLVDQDGTWRMVATVDEARADDVLEPWAAEVIRSGKGIVLAGEPRTVTVTAAGASATFTTVRRPPSTSGGYLGDTGAVYLVGSGVLDGVGAERPPDQVSVVRYDPLTDAETVRLRDLAAVVSTRATTDDPSLATVQAAVAGTEAARTAVSVAFFDEEISYDRSLTTSGSGDDDWNRVLLALAVASGVLALLVLTITLSLRSVDGEGDRRAAFAAGVAPAALRHQRAFEGVVLALLGALLALPLGWIPVVAVQLGADGADGTGRAGSAAWLSFPGWVAIPILLAPALAAAVLWTVVPGVAAVVRTARHGDLRDDLLPRF